MQQHCYYVQFTWYYQHDTTVDTPPHFQPLCNTVVVKVVKISPEIRYSGVKSLCCYENHPAGSKPISKYFTVVN